MTANPQDRPESLGTKFPEMQAHVRELLSQYQEIGQAGTFGRVMLEAVLRRADEAVISGDVVAMLRSYEEMNECQ